MFLDVLVQTADPGLLAFVIVQTAFAFAATVTEDPLTVAPVQVQAPAA